MEHDREAHSAQFQEQLPWSKSLRMVSIRADCAGWWRIVDTETWGSRDIDGLGPALLSLMSEGRASRRLACLPGLLRDLRVAR